MNGYRNPWLLALGFLAATAGALAFRLPQLALRPMHCDEANQAMKAATLRELGRYQYDPREHHGPSLYYATLPSLWLSGAKDFAQSGPLAYRIVPVLFGVGLVLLLPLAADGLGRVPALWAALLTALSPAMVFYSRYYIQEMLLVFLTFAAIVSAWRYVRSRSVSWAVAAGVFFALMVATKETWCLAAAAMGLGLALALAWARWRDGAWPDLRPHLRPVPLLVAAIAGLLLFGLFYSSLGTNPRGPADAVLAYGTYFRRGSEGGIHAHPWYYYLQILAASRPLRGYVGTETLIVGLAVVGFAAALIVAGTRRVPQSADGTRSVPATSGDTGFCRFLAFYTLALTAVYSAVTYKTPWCLLSLLHGMILLAGLGAWALLRWVPSRAGKLVVGLVLALAAGRLARESYLLNYRFYAYPERNPYVYAQASSDVVHLAAQVQRLARASGEGRKMTIHVVTGENYWPLPWYLRGFDHVGYWQDAGDWRKATGLDEPAAASRREASLPAVLVLTDEVRPAIDAVLGDHYRQKMTYGLQPGVLLTVYVRDDVWEAFLRTQVGPGEK